MDSIFNTCGARPGVVVPSPKPRLLQEEAKLGMCYGRDELRCSVRKIRLLWATEAGWWQHPQAEKIELIC